MKRIIIALCLIAGLAQAQTNAVFSDGVKLYNKAGGTLGVMSNALITGTMNVGSVQLTNQYCEADFADGGSQSFTGAAGFERITNFQVNVCHPMYTATSSNATISVSRWYRVYMFLSYDAGGASQVACHLFTNNVAATTVATNRIGWDRSTSAVGQDGVVGFEKLIYLPSGAVVDWRLDCDANETITWKHGTVGIEAK